MSDVKRCGNCSHLIREACRCPEHLVITEDGQRIAELETERDKALQQNVHDEGTIARLEAEVEKLLKKECHHGWRGATAERISAPCPACGGGVFIGGGGYLTCSVLRCPAPDAPHQALIAARETIELI